MKLALVTLNPTTNRHRQLIREHGAAGWLVLWREPSVRCFGGAPGLFVQAPDNVYRRWVRPEDVTDTGETADVR